MDLSSLIAQILDSADDEDRLDAQFGADSAPQAIYGLVDRFGWPAVFEQMVALLRDDPNPEHGEIAQIVLFYAAGAHPMPADSTIALLYHRFPGGITDGDRIWAIVHRLKRLDHGSDYDPMTDPAILREMDILEADRSLP